MVLFPSLISVVTPASPLPPALKKLLVSTVEPVVHFEELPEPGGSLKIKSTFSGP